MEQLPFVHNRNSTHFHFDANSFTRKSIKARHCRNILFAVVYARIRKVSIDVFSNFSNRQKQWNEKLFTSIRQNALNQIFDFDLCQQHRKRKKNKQKLNLINQTNGSRNTFTFFRDNFSLSCLAHLKFYHVFQHDSLLMKKKETKLEQTMFVWMEWMSVSKVDDNLFNEQLYLILIAIY